MKFQRGSLGGSRGSWSAGAEHKIGLERWSGAQKRSGARSAEQFCRSADVIYWKIVISYSFRDSS